MYDQTIKLCASLPQFADLIKAADRTGSAQWQIIQWENIDTATVRPDQVMIVGDLYPSRTEALRKSWYMTKPQHRNEKGHWGVLEWQEDGKTRYQSVMPQIAVPDAFQGQSRRKERDLEAVSRTPKEASPSTMIRISESSHGTLRRIAEAEGKTLLAVLDDAVQHYEKQWFFAEVRAAYQTLREDPVAWAEELKERVTLESTLMDGIDSDEIWHEDGTVTIQSETERKSA